MSETEIENLKKVKDGDDIQAIKSAVEALTQASHKLAELMYPRLQKKILMQQHQAVSSGAKTKKDDDDVVDADFEEVK